MKLAYRHGEVEPWVLQHWMRIATPDECIERWADIAAFEKQEVALFWLKEGIGRR